MPSSILRIHFSALLCGVLALLVTCPLVYQTRAQNSLCFEKISDSKPLYFLEHPGRNKAIIGTQDGLLTLVTLPPVGSKQAMKPISTWLDLRGRVKRGTETGLLSFAFHPRFLRNGRFFVSYICDSDKHPDCKSSCGCNPSVGCIVGQRNAGCSSVTIVSEYSTGPGPRRVNGVKPTEVRRILGFARPYGNHNGGHIFFGLDGYLYLTSGDGGSQNDPWDLAQNPYALLGKIIRLGVDAPFRKGYNFTVPWDNPFRGKGHPLVFAMGLRNPWRCDQDPVSRLLVCGDVGGNKVEEIDVITREHNYMWRNYEGDQYLMDDRNTRNMPGVPTLPVLRYTHDDLGGVGCVIGGVFYRARINKCLTGKYLFSDYSGPIWVSTISSKSTSRRVRFSCSPRTPLPCPAGGDGSDTEWAEILSWGRDIAGNAYMLTNSGVYRITRLPECNVRC